ncbi:hypothetical protein GYA49_03220 [Candidatus Beckwithbacteria bacterium]|nr:hypothetical protein [Candidatus Beckwithbacteria bacterium]
MKIVIVYDSKFGNTQKVAENIAKSFGGKHKVNVLAASKSSRKDLNKIDLLIVGSPTYGGRPTLAVQAFLDQIPAQSLKNIKVAAFDTRMLAQDQSAFLKTVMKIIGYAAPKILKTLVQKGGQAIVPAEGFIVTSKEGPLQKGELEKASKWLIKLG